MKLRAGFVSNSSSSSYVCEVCDETFEAWDEGISHFNLVMCEEYDHLFCEDHRINPNDDGKYTMLEYDDEERIDSKHCPICQMKEVSRHMVMMYALEKLEKTMPELKNEMKELFANYSEFDDFISGSGNEYRIELTAHVTVKAATEELARKQARKDVVEYPMKLDVTHCEKM